MHLVIIAAGSRGDVAPYTGLGIRLVEAGHRVTIGAHAPFRALVTDAGLGFHDLPGDVAEVLRVRPRINARSTTMPVAAEKKFCPANATIWVK